MTPPERIMTILKYSFIVSVLLLVVVAVKIPSNAAQPPQRPVELIVACVALANLFLGFAARTFLIRLANANSSRSANASLNQWMSANITSLALIESCALFALVLHMLGSTTKPVALLFGCALLALLVWTPGTPPTTADASGISQ